MQKTIIEITGEIELTYDENSPAFKEALAAFQDLIVKDGTVEDMLKHIAYNVIRFGHDSMIEGVGYVGYNGRIPQEDEYAGIMVGEDYDEFNFEIQ